MRILIMSDNPNIHTGMGKVGGEVALQLHKRGHEIAYLGWFSAPDTKNKFPFKIFKTHNMYYGSDAFEEVVSQFNPATVITIGDEWMINHVKKQKIRRWFQWIGYVPIDGHAYHGGVPNPWEDTFYSMDKVIAYTHYGKRVITKSCPDLDVGIIPHGVDINKYFPMKEEARTDMRKKLGLDDKVIFLVVARNQFRKNLPEIFKAWKIFKSKGNYPNAKLWLHCVFTDPMGWKLDELIKIYGMEDEIMYFEQVAYGHNTKMLEEKDLNKLYNISDIFLLQSGEGWGLPTTEAMACKKPVILLDHSANTEIGYGRGELVNVSCTMTGKYSTERPYPDLEDLANKMEKLYLDKELRKAYGEKAYEFAKKLHWDNIGEMWNVEVQKSQNCLYGGGVLKEVC